MAKRLQTAFDLVASIAVFYTAMLTAHPESDHAPSLCARMRGLAFKGLHGVTADSAA